MMGMILFDIASLAWLGAFIYLCKSMMQYTFSFLGFVFGLLGSLAMVAVDVMLGGQELVEPPARMDQYRFGVWFHLCGDWLNFSLMKRISTVSLK